MLFSTVVAGGYCVGCGACAVATQSPLVSIRFDQQYGHMEAHLASKDPISDESQADMLRVCPFSSEATNETDIGRQLFEAANAHFDEHIGFYTDLYAGYAAEGPYRDNGSSGGLTTWLLCELLDRDLIDGVLHVKPTNTDPDGLLFRYGLSTTSEDIRRSAKSRYYPIEMSHILELVKQTPGRYAIVGVPCFIKAIRLLMQSNPLYSERILFTIALFCGHLKTTRYADMLAWQLGILPGTLTAIDFRTKRSDSPANDYSVTVHATRNQSPISQSAPASTLFGTNWGYGLFKYNACDYCDDVVGETADVSFGDAWLPHYVGDSNGTNIVIVRHQTLAALLREAHSEGRVKLDTITLNSVVESQAGGFRHRRAGLRFRLHLKNKAGLWCPPKRVSPSHTHLSPKEQAIIASRLNLAKQSHAVFSDALSSLSFASFRSAMLPLLAAHDSLSERPRLNKLLYAIRNRRVLSVARSRLKRLWLRLRTLWKL
jgi:coenzyme F420 hydrogenase subunit beta